MITYECESCGACDCKLWRNMSSFQVNVICWECLEAKGHEVKVNNQPHGDDQVYDSDIEPTCYGPAVPDLDGRWWGYTSVPHWWVQWWKGLPDKKSHCTLCRGDGSLGEGKYKFDCIQCDGTGLRETKDAEDVKSNA